MSTPLNDLAAQKARLREEVLAARAAMSEAERREASGRILARLLAQPEFAAAGGVHCFVSLPGEVETRPIIEACWRAGKRTYIPYQIREEGRLGAARWREGEALARGPFGVPEPEPERKVPAPLEEIDLVVMPGVAFDRAGGRLGYGKAYYDIFLAALAQSCVKDREEIATSHGPARIALAFSVQLVTQVPRESWDLPVPVILTELEVIRVT